MDLCNIHINYIFSNYYITKNINGATYKTTKGANLIITLKNRKTKKLKDISIIGSDNTFFSFLF